MTSKIRISKTATNVAVINPEGSRIYNTVVYAGPVDGTATAGTITINCKAPCSTNFESPKDSSGVILNTIDIAAPQKLNIPGEIAVYEFTVTGFAGTATEIEIGVSSYGSD